MSWLKGLGFVVATSAVIGGYIALEQRYDINEKVRDGVYAARDAIVDVITEDPHEAAADLINSIENHRDELDNYNLGQVVSMVNRYRSDAEVDKEAVQRVINSDSRALSYVMEGMDNNKRRDTARYATLLLDDQGREFVAEHALESITDDRKYAVLEDCITSLPAGERQKMMVDVAEGFTRNQYESTISSLVQDSIAKYDNKMAIGKQVLFGE